MKPLRSSAPPTHLLNPARTYVPAAKTDIRATYDRIRKEQAQQEARQGERK